MKVAFWSWLDFFFGLGDDMDPNSLGSTVKKRTIIAKGGGCVETFGRGPK